MSNKRRKIDDRTLSIFAYLQPEGAPAQGSMNISLRLRHAVSEAIRKSGKDRIDICAEMYKLTGIEISKSTLDSWSAESRCISGDHLDYNSNKRWGLPAEIAPAFCQVTGEWEVLFIQAEAGNYKALKGKDVVHARMGLLKEEITRKNQELKDLEKRLLQVDE
jgi:hypothetical protein